METLLLLTYAALCIVIFKLFKIPLNKWTVPTAVLGGIILIGALVLVMNYNTPYTQIGSQVFRSVPIVPQVRGQVIEVPVKANQPLKQGDVLFRIDPTPFQAEVDNLKAQVKEASQGALSLDASLSGAQAELQRAVAQRDKDQREYARFQAGYNKGAFSEQMIDTRRQNYKASQAAVGAAQAKVREAKLALDSEINGNNTKVAALLAELRKAQFKLDHTVVRAPSDGYVTQVGLRPGVMATALGLKPVMTFIPVDDHQTASYVAAFRQNSLQRLQPGYKAEFIFPAIPGKVFEGQVAEVLPAIGESELQAQGKLLTTSALQTDGRALVVLNVTDARLADYHLPQGTSVEVAVYSGHFHHLAMIRKILIRMKSWQNFLYLDH